MEITNSQSSIATPQVSPSSLMDLICKKHIYMSLKRSKNGFKIVNQFNDWENNLLVADDVQELEYLIDRAFYQLKSIKDTLHTYGIASALIENGDIEQIYKVLFYIEEMEYSKAIQILQNLSKFFPKHYDTLEHMKEMLQSNSSPIGITETIAWNLISYSSTYLTKSLNEEPSGKVVPYLLDGAPNDGKINEAKNLIRMALRAFISISENCGGCSDKEKEEELEFKTKRKSR